MEEKKAIGLLTEAIDLSFPALVICGKIGSSHLGTFCEGGLYNRGNVLFVEMIEMSVLKKFHSQRVTLLTDNEEEEAFEMWEFVKDEDLSVADNLLRVIDNAIGMKKGK